MMPMKCKYRLFRRSSGIFFIQDNSNGRQETILDFPRRGAIGSLPFGKILPVKKHDGIGWRRRAVSERFARRDHRGHGPVWIMHVPFAAGDHGSVCVAGFVRGSALINKAGRTEGGQDS